MADHHSEHHTNVYEEVKLEEMMYDAKEQLYQYTCPCGDLFEIALEDLYDGEDIALCPSCSLKLRVLYDEDSLPELDDYSTDDEDVEGEYAEEKAGDECGSKNTEVSVEAQAGKGNGDTGNDVTSNLSASLSSITLTATIVDSK